MRVQTAQASNDYMEPYRATESQGRESISESVSVDCPLESRVDGTGDGSHQPDQWALVSKAQCGDSQAFCALVEPHFGLIYRSARKITGNHEDAEDACQESMIKAFVHIQSFKGNARFSTWLTRIAINEALMIVRKGRVEARHRVDDSDLLEMPRLLKIRDRSAISDPEAQCAQSERNAMLWDAINRLKEKPKAVVCSLGIEEANAQQIAEASHLSCSGLRSRRQRALRDLRMMLCRKISGSGKSMQEFA